MALHQAIAMGTTGFITPEAMIQDGIDNTKMTVLTENAGQSPPSPGNSGATSQNVLGKSIGLWVFIIIMFIAGTMLMPGRGD